MKTPIIDALAALDILEEANAARVDPNGGMINLMLTEHHRNMQIIRAALTQPATAPITNALADLAKIRELLADASSHVNGPLTSPQFRILVDADKLLYQTINTLKPLAAEEKP